jgi:hypothetical protein
VWSLGLLLVIGSAMTLTASLVVLPALIRLGERLRSPEGEQALHPHSMNLLPAPGRSGLGDLHAGRSAVVPQGTEVQ